jgi:hypothetical protein
MRERPGFRGVHVRMSWVLSVLLVVSLVVVPVSAQESLATVADVRPQATAGTGSTQVTLVRGSDLKEGETVITGQQGEVQIVFADQTHLVIGRGSSLVIERYLMRNDGTAEKFAVNALAGTFRFITGKGDKNAYSISTPTGTIGIRGTEFDFTVARGSGRTSVILFQGGVELCPVSGPCVSLAERCEVGEIPTQREAERISREVDRAEVATTAFPYVRSQSRLRREFRVRMPQQCATTQREAAPRTRVVADVLPPPPPPPPPDPEPEKPKPEKPKKSKDNRGWGNGGEGSEGFYETGNPGKGGGKGKHKHRH